MFPLATFAAGCFWHVQTAFDAVKGVKKTTVGYMGGKVKNPSYLQVCTHLTGHAEVCQVEYNQKTVSYEALLKVFWKIHDPTQKNRQGLESVTSFRSFPLESVGYQYRSVIFYYTEEYHQKYLEKKGRKVC